MEPGAKRTRRPWRDNLEAMVMAVVMALLLKHFIVEAYKIPSGSMQPTLIGDAAAGLEDRILVDKLSYLLHDPARWDVAVFRYPLDRSKSFVKRIAGLGPEELLIRDGDVFRRAKADDPWRIARRPRSVQRETWRRLDEEHPSVSPWIQQGLPRSSSWEAEGRSITARGPGTVAFHGGGESILDEYFDGYPESLRERLGGGGRSASRPVGDLRVAGTVRALAGLEGLTIVLKEGRRHYRFELPGPAAPENARTRIDAGPFVVGLEEGAEALVERTLPDDWRLQAGRATRFAAWNLDDRLELEIDGRVVAVVDIQPSSEQTSAIHLTLAGEGADLDDLSAWRDVYYIDRSTEPVAIPAGHYFMLGDNTQDSSDSREWTFVVFEIEEDPPRRLRGNWREGENPVATYTSEGPLTRLVDEWGEPHWFERGQAQRLPPEYAPFVPRAMIQGRALAVFWPLNPFQDVWRLKWVR